MSQIGALSIAITADGGQAIREMGNVDSKQKKTFADMGKSLRTNATQWAKWGAAAVAAAAGTYAALVRSQMGTIDSLAKTSDKLGIATEELQALRHAAELTGVSTGTLDTALQRMTRRVAEAAKGTGEAKAALEELGLDAQVLARLSPDEQFRRISDAMEGVANQGDRVRLAMRLFDTEGVALVNTMRGGREALDAYKQEVQDFGLAISRVDAAKVEQANDALFRAGEVMRGALTKAAVEVAPIITEISNRFIEAATDAETFGNVTDKVFSGIVYTVGKVGDVFHGWRIIIKSLEAAFYGLSTVANTVMAKILEVINKTMRVAAAGVNVLISGLNNIPGVKLNEIVVGESEFVGKLETAANSARVEFADAMFELRKLASEPLPSEQFEAFVDSAKKAAEEASAAFRDPAVAITGEGGEDSPNMYTMEENQKWLDELRQRFMTEDEIYQEKFAADLERLKEAREQELIAEDEYLTRRNQLEQDAAQRRLQIAEDERRARIGIISGMMQNLSTLMNTGSKKMFAIGKAAAIAQALIAGKEAVVNSYNVGSRIGGPPVGAAFAATAAVATAAQINQIRSQSFGGGSNPTTFSGGLPAVRTVEAGQSAGPVNPSQRVDINITGSGNTFSAEQVRELIAKINDQLGDGVNLAFGG